MNLTHEQKQEIVKALEAAKEYLGTSSNLVCISISRAYDEQKISQNQRNLACDYIDSMIKPHGSVTSWLHRNSHEYRKTVATISYDNHKKLCLDYRKKWVNHMIQELSK